MSECFACKQEITDLKGHDVLEIMDIDENESRQLLNAFNYIPSMQYRPNYTHFRCVSEHADLLAPRHRYKWVEWRVRQLEKENTDLKHKTETMKEEIVRLMQKAENQPQEIEDFLKGFAFYSN